MEPTPNLDELIREYRAAILRIERRQAADLMRQYRIQRDRALRSLDAMRRALRSGAVGPADVERWIRENAAVRALLSDAGQSMSDYATYAAEEIEARKAELVALAQEHADNLGIADLLDGQQPAPDLAQEIRAAFTSIPVEAAQSAVGALAPGSPLRALFDGFGEAASRKLGEALVSGVVRGQGAARVARAMRESLDGNAARALTIARTELHRSYREATLDRYRANPRVYSGWMWHANLDNRTCPACVSLHGSEHTLDESFGGHPNCRCRPLPITKPLSSIVGDSPEARELQERIDGAASSRPTGEEWFNAQTGATQRSILGPSKLDALVRGDITLKDVYVDRVDKVWGRSHSTASLAQARANAARRTGRPVPKAPKVTRTTKATPRKPKPPAPAPPKMKVEHVVKANAATKHFDAAVAAIRKVHDPDVTLRYSGSRVAPRYWGAYKFRRGQIGGVFVRDVPHGATVAVHEIGHAIDHARGGLARLLSKQAFDPTNPCHAWYQAVRASSLPDRVASNMTYSSKFAQYTLSAEECWARSYEQWIALRSGDDLLRRHFNRVRGDMPDSYWTDDEFGPIAAQLDAIFGVTP